jgi:hypothetical protein
MKLAVSRSVRATMLSAALAACGSNGQPTQQTSETIIQGTVITTLQASPIGKAVGTPGGVKFPDVIAVRLTTTSERMFEVEATLSSPYDTPERYADAFRVMTTDGRVLGIRELTHDHQSEQPFTRSLGEVGIQAGIGVVIIEGRDQANGWGGQRWEIAVP